MKMEHDLIFRIKEFADDLNRYDLKDLKQFNKLYMDGVKFAETKTTDIYLQMQKGILNFLQKTGNLCPFYKASKKEPENYKMCVGCIGADFNCPYYFRQFYKKNRK